MTDLLDVQSHYEFGRNWSDFAERLTPEAIAEAVKGLQRLAPRAEIAGQTVLDIGCGSGLHALAALRLGAARVDAVDLDPDSVATTKSVLERHAPPGAVWTASVRSVFELSDMERYPVVYSWGVLHHTGDMARAIACAADRVADKGRLYLALYRKTPLCPLWRLEKRLYTGARWARGGLEALYVAAFRAGLAVRGRSFKAYEQTYARNRGMNWMTDVRDWLGGYPYESISQDEMLSQAQELGFIALRRFCQSPGLGLLGTGCDEYAFARR